MKFTNQRLVITHFMTGFMSLPACVVGTTPGDQEFTVIGLFAAFNLRSSSKAVIIAYIFAVAYRAMGLSLAAVPMPRASCSTGPNVGCMILPILVAAGS